MNRRQLTLVILMAALTAAVAMAGPNRNRTRPADAPGPYPATLQAIQDNLFSEHCVLCHFTGSSVVALPLDDKMTSFNSLVGVASQLCSGETRVIPFQAGNSYLIKKLEGTMPCGDQMPLGDMPLEQWEINIVREWIDTGALADPPIPVANATWGRIKTLF